MDEDRQESHRSPVYTKKEVNALLNIIENYKNIILNKSTSTAASHAKDRAWYSIAKVFNRQGFKNTRSVDSIKRKWDNLKKDSRKAAKNIMMVKHENDSFSRVITMLLEHEKNEDSKLSLEIGTNDVDTKDNENAIMDFDECENEESDCSDGDMQTNRSKRSLNFLPQECSLLLKCVREEKDNIFIKETNTKANLLKNSAWTRIAESYNKQSLQKRSSKVLRTRFENMKKAAKSVHMKQNLLNNQHDNEKMKTELFDDSDINEGNSHETIEIDIFGCNQNSYLNNDPLESVINGDCGNETKHPFNPWCTQDSENVEKLKLQLLNYQLETAKMERKRVENAMQAEQAAFESRTLEHCLRVRAARLEVCAAQHKLPSNHPALLYTDEERPAQHYLERYT